MTIEDKYLHSTFYCIESLVFRKIYYMCLYRSKQILSLRDISNAP